MFEGYFKPDSIQVGIPLPYPITHELNKHIDNNKVERLGDHSMVEKLPLERGNLL